MKGATLQVLQIQWEKAWMSQDFDQVTKIDNARHVIEGLPKGKTLQAAPMSETGTPTGGSNRFEGKPVKRLHETAPRMQSRLVSGTFARLVSFLK